MNPTLVTAFALTVLLQVEPTTSLDDLLRSMDDGAPPPTKVEDDVAAAAALRIEPDVEPGQLTQLAALASVGQAPARHVLAVRLMDVVAERREASATAARLLAALPAEVLLSKTTRPEVVAGLIELVDVAFAQEDAALGVIAADLLGRWAPPTTVSSLLSAWAEVPECVDQAHALIARLPDNTAAAPAELVRALRDLPEDGGAWSQPLGGVARQLASSSPEAADVLLEWTRDARLGPSAAWLVGLGGVDLRDERRRDAARQVVLELVEYPGDPVIASAALRAAAGLMLDEVLPMLPALTLQGPVMVRVASIDGLRALAYKDAPTVDLLITLLSDPAPEVVVAAHAALCEKTGERFPGVAEAWTLWRDRVTLPEGPEEGMEAWLADRRTTVGMLRRHALKQAGRALRQARAEEQQALRRLLAADELR